MIFYLVTKNHSYTMYRFLSEWGEDLKPHIRIIHYETLFKMKGLPPGKYIFSDLERITDLGLKLLDRYWRRINDSDTFPRPLNRPSHVKKRLELLNTLYEAGVNDFNAYPIEHGVRVTPERFPVFIREANDHKGPRTNLIHNQEDLDMAISYLNSNENPLKNPIVTEFVDTSDKLKRYFKYAAYRFGRHLIPVHMFVSKKWVVKSGSSELDKELVQQEWNFVEQNPHEEQLRKIFSLANIEFGRIDYGLKEGRVQVFEINTNPTILQPGVPSNPDRLIKKQKTAKSVVEALRELDSACTR